MFQLGKTLVSEAIVEEDFVCNLSACKGTCCIDGDAGAPLDKEEVQILKDIYPKVKPFMRKEGIDVIESQGTSVVTKDGELETPLINNADCAYVVIDNKGIALCAIEEAYNQGEINICSDACSLGKELQVPVYKFVKAALIRKFGQDWYSELEKVSKKIKS